VIVKVSHCNGTAIEEAWLMVCLASVSCTDDPRVETGAESADCRVARALLAADITEGFFLRPDKLRA
jgi:hypothetical protein